SPSVGSVVCCTSALPREPLAMKRTAAIVALGAVVALAPAGRAKEPPHLEFVQGLRARNYPDLALEYLLKVSKTAPAAERPRLELEIARARLEIARAEPDAGKRPALLAQARRDFQAFVDKHPKSPQASEARVEITRIAVLLGRTQFHKALRQEGPGRATEAL